MRYVNLAALLLVTALILPGGVIKLLGLSEALLPFEQLGLPVWFALTIGLAECAGAIGIWFSRTRRGAALSITAIMLGAIYYHMLFPPQIGALPALLVLICTIAILSRGKPTSSG